ncbi:hypothetical protein OGAPHI_006987 [Ogataea philodendri]|uniref:RNase MRP protein 1 RNA binding domain-containing protein n=1 Tax=Ogataea philodendri TaxID=1378263 RepID=A0A9P8NWB1_9ASCO|nr:uncharacterized protein OGAPHI_006987 [Ogataea philodendri]KAH3660401.1 hypothetical protein OGAPHI_006987 [Ogataea philodendri]
MEAALLNEYQIIHLIYHRDSNQHRSAVWWKHFNILHRRLRTILQLLLDIDEISGKNQLTSLKFSKSHTPKFRKRNLSPTQADSLLKLKSGQLQSVIDYLLDHVLGACYYRFYSIIELGQYIALGFTLIASIARIRKILLQMRTTTHEKSSDILPEQNSQDLGELISPAELTTIDNPPPKKHKQKQKKKSRKTIDDIFGF